MRISLKEFRASFETAKELVPHISLDEITFLWFDDWYDGALSGILKYKNQEMRFEIITNYKKQLHPRIFAITQLSEHQIKDTEYWRSQFLKFVEDQPQSKHHLFYSEYKSRTSSYEKNEVIAWFVEK